MNELAGGRVERARGRLRRWLARHPRLSRAVDIGQQTARDARDDRVTGLAAEVAFFALLSVFPGLLAVAGALGALDGLFGSEIAERAEQEVIEVLTTFLTARAQGTVAAVRSLFDEASGGVFTFGVVAALWSASRGMATVLATLSRVYDFGETRSPLRRRAVAVGLAGASMVLVVFALAALVLGPLLGAGEALTRAVGLDDSYGARWKWLGLPVAFVAVLSWVAIVFHAVPHEHVGWRQHVIGAAFTGFLWLAVSVGFRLYLRLFGGNPVFGVLGGALVVLVWLYLLNLALLIGAELNAVLAHAGTPPGRPEPSPPSTPARSPAPAEGLPT